MKMKSSRRNKTFPLIEKKIIDPLILAGPLNTIKNTITKLFDLNDPIDNIL